MDDMIADPDSLPDSLIPPDHARDVGVLLTSNCSRQYR